MRMSENEGRTLPTKRQITAAAKAMFEVSRRHNQFGRKRDSPIHDDWDQCPKEFKDAYRLAARAGLKAAETVGQ